jgi:parallel beta-helix repeat protein
MNSRILAFALALVLLGSFAFASTNISDCNYEINASGTYVVNQSLSATGTSCIINYAPNVIIDCQGNSMTGDGTSGQGVYSNASNVTIRNCEIIDFGYGVMTYTVEAYNNTIKNTSITMAATGINGILIGGENNTIDCKGQSITGDGTGTGVSSDQNGTGVENCGIIDFDIGISIGEENINTTISNSTIQGISLGVDIETVNGGTITTSTISGAVGVLIWSSANFSFENVSVSSSTTAAIQLGGSPPSTYNTFNHLNLTGTGGAYGLDMELGGNDGFNVFGNSTMTSDYRAVYLSEANSNTFTNSNITSIYSYGIYLWLSSGNNISNSNITSTTSTGIVLSASNNNTLSNLNATSLGSGNGIYLSSSDNNQISNSNLSCLDGYGVTMEESQSNIIINNSIQGSANNPDLSFYPSSESDCVNTITNNTGKDGKPIIYLNDTDGNISNEDASDIILCGATHTNISNVLSNTFVNYYANETTIFNLTATSGFTAFESSGGNFSNITTIGIYIENGGNNTLANLNVTDYGIGLSSSSGNQIINSIVNAPTTGIDLDASANNNTILNNIIQSDLWVANDGTDNAFNNSTSGNRYILANGTEAWEFCDITDSNNIGWADMGTDLPFNGSTPCLQNGGSPYWIGDSDWHPYTPITYYPVGLFNLNVFYDVSGQLWYAYYNNNSSTMNISRVNGAGVLITENYTNGFGAVIRPSVLMSFSKTNAVFYNYSSGNSTLVSFPYSMQSNPFYDPYAYAYTKQYATLATDVNSYYLVMANNQTDSMLLKVNDSLNISIIKSIKAPAAWQSMAYLNTLHDWFYAFPEACGSNFNISLFYYNGTNSTKIATPDTTCYNSSNTANAKVVFEEKNGYIYFVQFNTSGKTVIYRINDGINYTLNYTMQSISPFIFYDENTTVFYSKESTGTFVYSCHVGTSINCIRNTLTDYGTSAIFTRANGVTSTRSGETDIIAYGSATIPTLSFQYNTIDTKLVCNDEVTFTQLPGNFRIFTSTDSTLMSTGTTAWEYAVSPSDLGTGDRRIYSLCTDGSNRQYFLNNTGFSERTYTLNTSMGYYYSFQITDCHGFVLNDVKATARRYISNLVSWDIVEQSLSQIDGTAVLFLQPSTPYNLTFESTGRTPYSTVFSPALNGTIPISLDCPGTNISVPPIYESIYNELVYYINPPGHFVTNTSVKINMTAASAMGKIISVNWVITKIPTGTANITNYSNTIVYNSTSTSRFGYNTSYTASGSEPAIYNIVGTINYVRDNINNINGSYNRVDL